MNPETLREVWDQEVSKCQMIKAKYVELLRRRGVGMGACVLIKAQNRPTHVMLHS